MPFYFYKYHLHAISRLVQLAEKQVTSPQEQKQRQDEQVVITKAVSNSSDAILTDLSALKSKIIKQITSVRDKI
ncbi:hypothetical protein [Rickettsia endosymbiont of Oedothorax gibbosus]|uniref:hypothetical protein n=1 Tax=Rickettsia endosymbiont of Oedothorax gibbosus TaxID=931099 RepID=UPI0020243138|nr:hypothetical protein [Rickettsia endosymbiont of Oedothorax gibbosus]